MTTMDAADALFERPVNLVRNVHVASEAGAPAPLSANSAEEFRDIQAGSIPQRFSERRRSVPHWQVY